MCQRVGPKLNVPTEADELGIVEFILSISLFIPLVFSFFLSDGLISGLHSNAPEWRSDGDKRWHSSELFLRAVPPSVWRVNTLHTPTMLQALVGGEKQQKEAIYVVGKLIWLFYGFNAELKIVFGLKKRELKKRSSFFLSLQSLKTRVKKQVVGL